MEPCKNQPHSFVLWRVACKYVAHFHQGRRKTDVQHMF
uniref:Uncharacterized protein n=1 Tax=Setaria italica TaxID=4555 RepID=K3XTG3_SETIT